MRKVVAMLLAGCAVPTPPAEWTSLFDGRTLSGWSATDFGAQGEVHIEDGRVVLEIGEPLTGITWTGDFPTLDYEVRVDAARLLGTDFFCGLTFPVGDAHCSLILGGWGGSLVGLSSVDGEDASENPTRSYRNFADNQTYSILLRVTADSIQAWVDEEQVVDQPVSGHTFSIRPEVELSRPFGIASFITAASIRNLQLRLLDP